MVVVNVTQTIDQALKANVVMILEELTIVGRPRLNFLMDEEVTWNIMVVLKV